MGKLAPEELWRRHTLERLEAFRQSGELKKLRNEGLAACGRKKRFTVYEWATSPMSQRYLSSQYMEWHRKCETIGRRFGLAIHTAVAICLISGYQPEKEPFVIEAGWPRIRLVTEQTNPLFLARLSYEACQVGLNVIQRCGAAEVILVPPNFPPPEALPAPEQPPRDSAFYLRVETPLGYPPEAARKLQSEGARLTKELLGRLGYSIPKRLRSSRLVPMAEKLRVAGGPVTKREAEALGIAIIDDLYGDDDLTKERKRLKLIASRRHKLRKRLIKPYEP